MKLPTRSVGAGTAARHLHRSPLPAVPRLPRLRHGIRFLRLPDGIQFDGGPEREVLRGTATRHLLPRLLPLLDGAHDVAALAEAAGSETGVIERLLALLHLRGLLEEGAFVPGTPTALALSRLGATTWADAHAGQSVDRLAAARVALHGTAPLLSELAGALREAGTGEVVTAGPQPCPADLAVVLLGPCGMAGDEAERLSAAYAREPVALLPWFVAGPVSVIGPLLAPELDLCLGCLRRELADTGSTPPPGPADPWTAVHAALACREVLALLAHVPPAHSPDGATRYDLEAWTTERAMPTAGPSCPVCRPRSAAEEASEPAACPGCTPAAGRLPGADVPSDHLPTAGSSCPACHPRSAAEEACEPAPRPACVPAAHRPPDADVPAAHVPTAGSSCPACHPRSAAEEACEPAACPGCVPAAGRPLDADPVSVAVRYHQAVAKPALHRVTPASRLQSLSRLPAAVQERRRWPSAALVPLPALPAPGTPWRPAGPPGTSWGGAADAGTPRGPAGPPGIPWDGAGAGAATAAKAPALGDLALLLGMTAGRRGAQGMDFWAPSGGNLGSPCLYLAARGIDGLADGCYGYDALAHALARLAGLPAVDLVPGPHAPSAVLVLTGDVPRIQGKYGPFALHLACLDAGVALTQLETAAGLLGHRVTLHDDLPAPGVAALADAFLIDSGREPVTAVLSVTPHARDRGEPPPSTGAAGPVHPQER